MTFDPSDLALVAFVLLIGAGLTEAYLTYRDWWRRWRTPVRPRPGPVAVRGPFRDAEDQAPFGHGTSLMG
jgi:hypothetical protein